MNELMLSVKPLPTSRKTRALIRSSFQGPHFIVYYLLMRCQINVASIQLSFIEILKHNPYRFGHFRNDSLSQSEQPLGFHRIRCRSQIRSRAHSHVCNALEDLRIRGKIIDN